MHKPIQLQNIALSFPHRTCFANFSAEVHSGQRIGIIGNNGSGKSSLLHILQGDLEPAAGEVKLPQDACIGSVPQMIQQCDTRSGAQRFQQALSNALAANPNVLLLDEPTNHLDQSNRKSLMRLLQRYRGTLIVASHDLQLLRCCIDTLWHIHQGHIRVFAGRYDDYLHEIQTQQQAIAQQLSRLNAQKKEVHNKRMKQQQQAAKRKAYGEKKYAGDKLALRSAQGRGQATANRYNKRISTEKSSILQKLSQLHLPEIIKPKFCFPADHNMPKTLVTINNGSIGYSQPLLSCITLSMSDNCRVAITGDNGSGKSTLIRAILGYTQINKSGDWHVPQPQHIGYLDQHYNTLDASKTVIATIQTCAPHWTLQQTRKHLNDFLFHKNDAVNARTDTLSGGEKARLCLACIAAKTPRLLILDEATNNLDLTTRNHMIQVLKEYPAAFIVISHDGDFLEQIDISRCYHIKNKRLLLSF